MFGHGWVIVNIGVWDDYSVWYTAGFWWLVGGVGGVLGWIFIVLDAGHFLDLR
jgi:hypothetical protein